MDAKDYLGDSWDKYFLKEGKEVVHKSEVKKDDPTVLIVDRVLTEKPKTKEDPENKDKPIRIIGVKCHWFKDAEYHTGVFHTKELVPLDVVKNDQYEDWLAR